MNGNHLAAVAAFGQMLREHLRRLNASAPTSVSCLSGGRLPGEHLGTANMYWYTSDVPTVSANPANPFIYDRPLSPGDAIDRPTERGLLADLADGGQTSRLAAPRRYGKTTMITALAAERRTRGWIVAVSDFSRCRAIEDVAERLYDGWRRGLDRQGTRSLWRKANRELEAALEAGLPGVARARMRVRQSQRGERPLARLHSLLALPERLAEVAERRILVVFDEFQDLLTAGEDLDGLVRSHVQHHVGVASYCYAGSQATLLRALFEDRRRPLFGQAREVALRPIPVAAIADWVAARFEAGGRPLPAESPAAVAAITEGHPQRAAMVAHFLWQQPRLDEAGVRVAEADALQNAAGELEQLWGGLTRAQRQVIGAVADGETELLGRSTLEEMGLGKSTAQQARDALVAEGHLRRDSGSFAAVDPFLARWLRR
jgi:uncharacterized protein